MNLKLKLTSILLFMFSTCVFSQSKEEVIQSVRDRYYRINSSGISLIKITMDNVEYYLENNKLAIIKASEKGEISGRYEFYIDKNRDEYYPYFIYFVPNNKDSESQIRIYYNEDIDCVLYKLGQEELDYKPWNPTDKAHLLKGMNYLNTFVNISYETVNKREKKITEIDKLVKQIDESIVQIDTAENNVNEEETYESHLVINFKNKNGEVIKKQINSGSDHVWSEKFTYMDNRTEIYSIERSIVTFQNSTFRQEINYYYLHSRIKTIEYDSYGILIDKEYNNSLGCWEFDFDDFVPRITYKSE